MSPQPPPTRVALYTRVSTDEQAREGYSLDAQAQRATQFAGASGWVIAKTYVDDGFSGRNTSRPGYQAMMRESDSWDIILVYKLDRVHRNMKNFIELMDHLARHGKSFSSVCERLDTTNALGRFFMDMMQRLAQLESEQIGERVLVGMAQKARTEKCWMGRPPFGYTVKDGNLAPEPEQAKWVRWMFKQYREGLGLAAIVQVLSDMDVKMTGGRAWTMLDVKRVLRNPTFIGVRIWNGHLTADNHPAIMDEFEFQHVKKMLTGRRLPGRSGSQAAARQAIRDSALQEHLERRTRS